MQRDSDLIAAGIVDPMETDIIGDVGYPIHSVGFGRFDTQRLGFPWFIFWGVVDCFVQFPSQNFHDAVGVGVVVDRRSFARVPYEEKLYKSQHDISRPATLKSGS